MVRLGQVMKIFEFRDKQRKPHYVKIDDADACVIRGYKWNLQKNKRGDMWVERWVVGEPIQLGRFLMGVTESSIAVTHKNGDQLDYRRANLIAMDKNLMRKMHSTLGNSRAALAHAGHFSCGHPDAPENTYNDYHVCKTCHNESMRKVYAKKVAKKKAYADLNDSDL